METNAIQSATAQNATLVALAHNYRMGRYDQRNEWASKLADEAYSHLIEADLIYDPEYTDLKNK